MQTDYAGQTVPLINAKTGEIRQAQIFVAVLPASNLAFSYASESQKLPDWIEGQKRALIYFGGVTKAIVCDNLKSGVAVALWFEPTITATFEAFSEHYGTTVLPTRVRRARDKAKIEGSVLITERWILARLRNQTFFCWFSRGTEPVFSPRIEPPSSMFFRSWFGQGIGFFSSLSFCCSRAGLEAETVVSSFQDMASVGQAIE